jgi:hypothetical protein
LGDDHRRSDFNYECRIYSQRVRTCTSPSGSRVTGTGQEP